MLIKFPAVSLFLDFNHAGFFLCVFVCVQN